MLAEAAFDSPLFWALFIGWILTVVLHEFAHGVVALWGGDWTIRQRGGLTLNPLQYVDPVTSIIMPAIFLAMGGVPLPGGSTYIRRDLLRSRAWETAVSAAGPAMNLLIFLLCALALHPAVGWVGPGTPATQWTAPQLFVGALAVLQVLAALLNLMPVPPLDGFQMIAPYLNGDLREKLTTPPLATFLFLGYFVVLWKVPQVFGFFIRVLLAMLGVLGYDPLQQWQFVRAFDIALWGGG